MVDMNRYMGVNWSITTSSVWGRAMALYASKVEPR